jgi:transposase
MAKILAIDLGKFKSVACILNSADGEYSYRTVATTPSVVRALVLEVTPDRIVIEIGSQAGWIADLSESLGVELQVANPHHEAWRWKNVRRKTDRDDALRLAQMSEMESLPSVHMPKKATRQWRSFITYRHTLVTRRTAIKNGIRSILDQQGITWPSGRAGWTKKTLEKLSTYASEVNKGAEAELWRLQLALEHRALQQVEQLIDLIEAKLDAVAAADERVRRLRTIPGVGPRLGELVVAIVDDPHRFRTAKQLGAYAGLVPKQYESGTMSRQGRITGRGNTLLRAILVEVGWMMRRYNTWFEGIFDRVCRGAKTRKKIAVVAVARRILICCWAMLRDQTDWRCPVPT